MSELSQFLKSNKKVRENVKYAATKSLCDKDGKPLEWELKPLSAADHEDIRDTAVKDGKFSPSLYRAKVIAACVVYPDLYDSELLDSYGVYEPEKLVSEMVDDVAEYNALFDKVMSIGENSDINEEVKKAKN